MKAVQYLRMSTDNQRYSLEQQKVLISAYADRHGYEIIRSYEDAGRSGMTIKGRTGLQGLIADVLQGADFRTILVLDVSRWGRFQNPDQAAHYEFLCAEAGVKVEYCAEAFNNDDAPTSAIMKGVKRIMAAEYSRQLSDRCRAGMRRTILAGNASGGEQPYGFARQIFEADGAPGKILERGERRSRADQSVRIVISGGAETDVIREIYSQFLEQNLAMRAIARNLNAQKIPYCRPGAWTEGRVRAVLTNEYLTGVRTFAQSDHELGGGRRLKPRETWLRVQAFEPIISSARFQLALTRIRAFSTGVAKDEHVIATLRKLARSPAGLSRRIINAHPDLPSMRRMIARFGSLREIYALIGYTPRRQKRSRCTKADLQPAVIERRMKALLARHGYLSAGLIGAEPKLPSVVTLIKRYGSLRNAYIAIGYEATRSEIQSSAWADRRARAYDVAMRRWPSGAEYS